MSADPRIERIARVDPAHADSMRGNPTTFEERPLPFYRRFRLVRARIALRSRPVELLYADDGAVLVPLATPEAIFALNQAEGLRLTLASVPAYARYFVECTGVGRLVVRESADGIRWLPGAETDPVLAERKRQALSRIGPVEAFVSDAGGFVASVTAQRDRALVSVTLHLAQDGTVTAQQEAEVVSPLPVPYAAR